MQPEAWVALPVELCELPSLVDRLHSFKEVHQQETNRLESAMNQPSMKASIQSHLQWLQVSAADLWHRQVRHAVQPPLQNKAA